MKGKMNVKNETMESITEKVASEIKDGHSNVRAVVFAALAIWLGVVLVLGARGAFVQSGDSPPLPIFLGVAIPLVMFFVAYSGWREFRNFILGADVRLVAAIQAWRWAGLGFLSLLAHGILPALFALPAGLGDMAVGVTAPWIVLQLIRRPSFASSRRFVMWNIFGIIDFIVAVSMGTLCSGFLPAIARFNGNITSAPMAQLPLVLIPAYMVPFFIMLHSTAIFQARRSTAQARAGKK